MILGIDASNIRAGGGVTHLVELLRAAAPFDHGFNKVIVWGGALTLSRIVDRPWLQKVNEPLLSRGLVYRVFWQRFLLSKLAERAGCAVLFVPGGSDASDFQPMVAMSQNLLPFEWGEMRRYGFSWVSFKFLLLRFTQSITFRKAGAVIFLTKYARNAVLKTTGMLANKTVIIPHGVDTRFSNPPRPQRMPSEFTESDPCRILYVSIVDMYKHQWHVAEAVAQLRTTGLPITLDLVGPAYAPAMYRLKETLQRIDPEEGFIHYRGLIPHEDLHRFYEKADINVFASSCETFGQVLTEAMSSGLPIACSDRSAMPELLGDAGIYFDPETPNDIARALRELIESADLRASLAKCSFERAQAFSWQRCARETFGFLKEVGSV